MAIHSRTIAWKIPWTEEPGRLQPTGSQRVGHDWATSLSFLFFHYGLKCFSMRGNMRQYKDEIFTVLPTCWFTSSCSAHGKKTHERFPRVLFFIPGTWTSLVAQTVKCLSTMRKTWVRSLGREDPLEKEMAIHSSTLAWKIPWTEEPGRLQSMGSQRVRHDWVTELTDLTYWCYYFYNASCI